METLKAKKVPYFELNLFQREPDVFRESVEGLIDHLRNQDYDLIHAHAGVPAAAAHSALDRIGRETPVIGTFYSWGLDRPEWMDTADLAAFSRCRRMTVVSSFYKRFLVDRGLAAGRIEIIPPGINSNLLEIKGDRGKLEEACGFKAGSYPLIADLAVIEPRKNQMAAIEAVALLPPERHVHLAFIGTIKDQEYHGRLMAAAERFGLGGWVAFTGHVDDPIPLLKGADLFLFPSLSEGLGIAILEAMAVGVPVIASPVEGAADIVLDGDTAIAVDPNDPKRISWAIEMALETPALMSRLASRAGEMVRRLYLWPQSVKRYIDLYRRAVEDTKS